MTLPPFQQSDGQEGRMLPWRTEQRADRKNRLIPPHAETSSVSQRSPSLYIIEMLEKTPGREG
jgi:hypothetical protein